MVSDVANPKIKTIQRELPSRGRCDGRVLGVDSFTHHRPLRLSGLLDLGFGSFLQQQVGVAGKLKMSLDFFGQIATGGGRARQAKTPKTIVDVTNAAPPAEELASSGEAMVEEGRLARRRRRRTRRNTADADTALSLLATETAAPTANNPNHPLPVVENVNNDDDDDARATDPPGRSSHSHLPALDSITGSGLAYNEWQDYVRKTKEIGPTYFDVFLITMRTEQSIHEGNRSHPQL